jgi:quinohemoprotein ethanol dehydrogenase
MRALQTSVTVLKSWYVRRQDAREVFMKRFGALLGGVALLVLAACGEANAPLAPITAAGVDGDAIIAADQRPDIWISHGRTYSEQRYSPLKQVTTANVKDLGVAWSAELDSNRGMESTPIVVDGVMYLTSAWSIVYAYDAKTGERLWKYDPEVDKARGVSACCDVVNRGVAIWGGKIFVGTIDGRLIALDASRTKDVTDGQKKPAWEVITVDQSKPYTITGAPRVVKGKVIIGNGGAELGVRGYVSAYNVEDGSMAWRFFTTPNPNKQPDGAASDKVFAEKANATWGDKGEWVEAGGGGTAWDAQAYDPELDILYIGVGNGSPWNQRLRDPEAKDNLFLSSILALKPDTGEYVWHYQTTPGETWDYTATQHIMLADLEIGGTPRKVVMQAPKNGFFYVLDRATGELISADKFQDNVNWATHVDLATGRPVEAPNARYESPQTALQIPGPLGSHNWHPMAFSPDTGLVYIPAHTLPTVYADMQNFRYRAGAWNTGTDFAAAALPTPAAERMAAAAASMGELVAWDPVAKKARWTVKYPNAWNGGVLATAGGLVFQGALDGMFRAYDAANGGAALWETNTDYPALSGPITYEIDGEQYVAVTAGWGTALPLGGGVGIRDGQPRTAMSVMGRVIVYKIGGKGVYETSFEPGPDPLPKAEDFGSVAMIEHGREVFFNNCMVCHGDSAQSGGIVTDLRWSTRTSSKESFAEVVMDGLYASAGMASFAKVLTPDDVESVRAYIVNRANEDYKALQAAAATPPPN